MNSKYHSTHYFLIIMEKTSNFTVKGLADIIWVQ